MATPLEGTVRSAQLVGGIALNPAFTASALAFLSYGPPILVAKLADLRLIQKYVGIRGLKVALRVLLGLGVARILNRFLNIRASNNWRSFPHRGWRWSEEVAVVTGGCSGIGKAIALGLTRKGIRVAILDVADLPPDLAELDAVRYYKCDVVSPDAVSQAADHVRGTLGHPSILINNAGVGDKKLIRDSTPEEISKVFNVNVISHWHTVKAFLPNMVVQNKGHIVTIASMASFVALPTAVGYSSSKAAVLGFHEGLSCEIKNLYKAPGVMTTVVHPMFVRTNMVKSREEIGGRELLEVEDVSDVVVKQILSRRGAQLIIPPQVSWLSGIRGFPNWLQETMRDIVARLG